MMPFSPAVSAVMRFAHVGTGDVQVVVVAAVVLGLVAYRHAVVVVVNHSAQRLRRRLVERATMFAREVHRNYELPR